MRKLLCIIAILTMAFELAACSGGAGSDASQEPSNAETTAPAETQTPAEEEGSAVEPEFYGEWTVQEAVGSTQVSTGVDENMIGKKAAYSKEKASFDGEEVSNPVYEETVMTSEQFVAEYRVQPSNIGLRDESVKIIAIKDWTAPGSLLLIKDEQTIITLWNGTFYSMKKE